MRIAVLSKQLPDLVEELEVLPDGTDIDREFVKFVTNEWDEAALEEALLIKEAVGAEVVVVGLDEPEVDQALYTAVAKGADKVVKLTGVASDRWMPTHERASLLTPYLAELNPDLVLTGVQAADDLDGQLAGVIAARLGVPHAAVVISCEAKDGTVTVTQELGSGISTQEQIRLPAVIGIQAARQAPRYAPIGRIRQAMAAGGIEEVPAGPLEEPSGGRASFGLQRLYVPERSSHAEMLEGSADEVARRIVELLRSRGLIKS